MTRHKNILEPITNLKFDKKRSRVKFCPCGKNNKDGKFVPFVGFENKGYCHSCGDTFLPELPKADQRMSSIHVVYKPLPITPQPKQFSFIPVEVFKASLKDYQSNNFVYYLNQLFGVAVTNELISKYFIASSNHIFKVKDYPNYISEKGSTVFWQVDTKGKIRTGKIMLYSPITGNRVKEPFNHINFVHKFIKQPQYELKQCLFAEHLLIDKTKPVAIVESEKTAIIASVYFPQFIWLAVGSISNFNVEKCRILKGRIVNLFPDLSKPKEGELSTFEKWSNKAKELSHLATFNISDYLERKATSAEKQNGLDLADYLVRYDYKAFSTPKPALQAPTIQALNEVKKLGYPEPVKSAIKPEHQKNESCEQVVNQLENFFKKITLPNQPIKLNQCTTITDIPLFIEGHLKTIKKYQGQKTCIPHIERLKALSTILKQNI